MGGFIPFYTAESWLNSRRAIWLATTSLDESPHVAPVWYVWDGAHKCIYFATGPSAVKVKNIARQPAVVLNLGDGDDTLILKGQAVQVQDTAERARFDAMYQEKYVDPHSGAKATLEYAGGLLYRVDVKHIMMWEYGIVSTRTDWHF
jgi:hypothetical protein